MLFIILRIDRVQIPLDAPTCPGGVEVKFFPLRHSKGHPEAGEPLIIDAESPDAAFKLLTRMFSPYLRNSLALQPLTQYQDDLARFAAIRAEREHPRHFPASPVRAQEARRPRN